MKIETNYVERMTLEEFADKHDLIMEVNERNGSFKVGSPMRFYAHFKYTDVKERGMLGGLSGDGSTPEEAIENYAQLISEKEIAVDAFGSCRGAERRDIKVPCLTGVSNAKE